MYELSKDRYLELKHHCAQYLMWFNEWGRLLLEHHDGTPDPTGEKATRRAWLAQTTGTIAKTIHEAFDGQGEDGYLKGYYVITRGLRPEGNCNIERYRKFFWLLDKKL